MTPTVVLNPGQAGGGAAMTGALLLWLMAEVLVRLVVLVGLLERWERGRGIGARHLVALLAPSLLVVAYVFRWLVCAPVRLTRQWRAFLDENARRRRQEVCRVYR